MFVVYMLSGANGRHYIGMTSDQVHRIQQHRNGHTYTTRRLGGNLQLVASKAYPTREAAAAIEKKLKRWKNPTKAEAFLNSSL